MDSFFDRLKVVLYAIPIVLAVVAIVGIVFLVIRDVRQQTQRRVILPDRAPVVAGGAPHWIDAGNSPISAGDRKWCTCLEPPVSARADDTSAPGGDRGGGCSACCATWAISPAIPPACRRAA